MKSFFFFRRRAAMVLVATSFSIAAAIAGHNDHGIPNFRTVNRDVCSGGQPSKDGFKYLAKKGFRTVVDLREAGGRADREEQLVQSLGMRYVSVPMKGMRVPSDAQIDKALAVLEDRAAGPVFVHCKRGKDRTGTVIACYRIQHDGWDKKKALREANKYGMSWYQLPLKYYVLRYKPQDGGSAPVMLDADDRAIVPATP